MVVLVKGTASLLMTLIFSASVQERESIAILLSPSIVVTIVHLRCELCLFCDCVGEWLYLIRLQRVCVCVCGGGGGGV
jgi:hypothetical protein